jgi:hypothetical protein
MPQLDIEHYGAVGSGSVLDPIKKDIFEIKLKQDVHRQFFTSQSADLEVKIEELDRKMKIALATSLAINVLLTGLVLWLR